MMDLYLEKRWYRLYTNALKLYKIREALGYFTPEITEHALFELQCEQERNMYN